MLRTPSYDEAIASLSGLIPELFVAPARNGVAASRRKFSLDEIRILCAALGNPQEKFPSVLIAGTNGKGSTAATLGSIACASGLKTGLYTSPHLERVNERIRLLTRSALTEGDDGIDLGRGAGGGRRDADIPDDAFAAHYFRVHDTAQRLVLDGALSHLPSYFELLTTLAFLYFAEERVDLAVLEVGMGGRLDATNLVDPVLSVITDISLDHQEWLGATIAEISREKAGILRAGGRLVTLPQHPEANQALGEVAMELGVRGIAATDYMPGARTAIESKGSGGRYAIAVPGGQILVDSPLKGAHQQRNVALAVAAAVELKTLDPGVFRGITAAAMEEGIRVTYWPGRLERVLLPDGREVILDVAHNPAGAWALRAALSELEDSDDGDGARGDSGARRVLIFACLKDKPLGEMTQILFPLFDHVILAPIHSARATEMAELVAAAEATGTASTAAGTVEEALDLAIGLRPGRIVISGSVYLVGEARHLLIHERNYGQSNSGEARRRDG